MLLPTAVEVPNVLDRVVEWYAEVSGGAVRLEVDVVRVDAGDPAWSQLANGWRWPADADDARDAVRDLVAGLAERDMARIGSGVLIVAPGERLHPHTWRFRNGGVHLGERRWCRRYALVATGSPFSAVAHELGHLLFGWPDLSARSIGFDCLMATGALVPSDRPPAWPCAPLRVGAGWVTPMPVQAATLVGDLPHGTVGEFDGMLIERRDDRLVAFADDPLRVEIRAESADPSRPVLAVLAEVFTSADRSARRPSSSQSGSPDLRRDDDRALRDNRHARIGPIVCVTER